VRHHPPPLAFQASASYGEMSRRSGEAATADNHSDISPFKWNQQVTGGNGTESATSTRCDAVDGCDLSKPRRSAAVTRSPRVRKIIEISSTPTQTIEQFPIVLSSPDGG
jgi:hypothetical protein